MASASGAIADCALIHGSLVLLQQYQNAVDQAAVALLIASTPPLATYQRPRTGRCSGTEVACPQWCRRARSFSTIDQTTRPRPYSPPNTGLP
jgi:hypothetical protein